MIVIHNVRLGHACNSSSSHSIVLMPPNQRPADDYDGSGFYWDNFTLASKEAKQQYMGAQLRANLVQGHGDTVARDVVRSWLGIDLVADSVDHQSVMSLPRMRHDRRSVDKAFFMSLYEAVLDDAVVVLGGNDNDNDHPLKGVGRELFSAIRLDEQAETVARADAAGFWTIYYPHSGDKIRLTMGASELGEVTKSSAPELVDVKITDRCPFRCAYCYQGSTPEGNDADMSYIHALAEALGQLETFEVALGGGEPTLHPAFKHIVRAFHLRDITVNVTTKNKKFFCDRDMDDVQRMLGAVAVSVGSYDDVRGIVKATRGLAPELRAKVKFQLVMGLCNKHEFKLLLGTIARAYEEMMKDAPPAIRVNHRRSVTLLGFKTTGFGSTVVAKDYKWWLDVVKKSKDGLCFSIDTALAEQTGRAAMTEAGIPSYLYGVEEGKFSMYVDAVARKMGPSSYCDSLLMRPLDNNGLDDKIRAAFERW